MNIYLSAEELELLILSILSMRDEAYKESMADFNNTWAGPLDAQLARIQRRVTRAAEELAFGEELAHG